MPVPPFTAFWGPFLKALDDGDIHRVTDLAGVLAEYFQLSDEERSERISSGRTRVLDRAPRNLSIGLRHRAGEITEVGLQTRSVSRWSAWAG